MFKKSFRANQLDMFNTPSTLMCTRESEIYSDQNAWHNKFFREVTSKIEEETFRPLYKAAREDKKDGRPTVSIRILVAMSILKEGCGCSDEQLYENCRFNLLFRSALGLFNLREQCPSLDSYYMFRRRLAAYEEETQINLFDKCFKQITKEQAKEYEVSGRSIRMDSKLISSNIAWYSRYEIIQKTFCKEVTKEDINNIPNQLIRQQALTFLDEDAAKTVYKTDSEAMNERLLSLGIVISNILSEFGADSKPLLARVFDEQYEKSEDGTVSVRDKKKISAKSVQNPNDPDAQYRSKDKQKVKGYSVNITETTDEAGKPSLITDVIVKGATVADNSFLERAVKESAEVTGNKVETVHADGAYQSEHNREIAKADDMGFAFMANGIQGKPSRYDLILLDDNRLEVTDKLTGEVMVAIPVKGDKWKIKVTDKDGKSTWRYFTREQVAKSETRREINSIPSSERIKRNNVEASVFQYCYLTRNNKTRYRGMIKHSLQAIARCAWINMRRLFLFDLKMMSQGA
jgi:hypothetical protein